MDTWSVIAICLVVPAVLFLVGVSAVSALRLSRRHARFLLVAGLIALPVVAVCVWMNDQPWLVSPWGTAVEVVGFAAGALVVYAGVAAVTLGVRRSVALAPRCS